jgi:hypothetical protein
MKIKYILYNVSMLVRLGKSSSINWYPNNNLGSPLEDVAWTIQDTKICQLRLIDASRGVTYNEEVQTFEFAKPFTLKKQFEHHRKKGDVEAILHYNDKRVTVLFPQDNWYTFELQAN